MRRNFQFTFFYRLHPLRVSIKKKKGKIPCIGEVSEFGPNFLTGTLGNGENEKPYSVDNVLFLKHVYGQSVSLLFVSVNADRL